jgi:hypothetical protein
MGGDAKVIRVYAVRIVAKVVNNAPFSYWLNVKLVREPVRLNRSPFVLDLPIAKYRLLSGPRPAAFPSVDPRPEKFLDGSML